MYSGYGRYYRLKHFAAHCGSLFPEVINVAYEFAETDGCKDISSIKALSRAYHAQNGQQTVGGTWVLEREKEASEALEKLNKSIEAESWHPGSASLPVYVIHFQSNLIRLY